MEWERGNGLEAYGRDVKAGLAKGLALAAEHIMAASLRDVPIEEGTLQNSADTSVNGLSATVSYSTPYAVYVHEDMTARHDAGRSAKFLENAINNQSQQAAEIIARTVKGVL